MTTATKIKTSDEAAGLVAQYGALKGGFPGAGEPWLDTLREAGINAFAELGFPGPKVEAWKYTNLNALRKLDFRAHDAGETAIRAEDLPAPLIEGETGHRLVFVNGGYRPGLSQIGELPEGVLLGDLAGHLGRTNGALSNAIGQIAEVSTSPILALNTAMMQDGYVLVLGPDTAVEEPIEIIHMTVPGDGAATSFPRSLILAEAGSRATVVERYASLGDGPCWLNGAGEIRVGRGAEIRLYKEQGQGSEVFHTDQATARLEDEARLECFSLMLGGRLARNEFRAELAGTGAACFVNGAYALTGAQHGDTLTAIDHGAVNTTSRQVFKGVLDGAARAVFQGKVLVRPGAQGTDGQQLNKTLLLSDKAEIDTKPELEIHADDVKCGHGATAGELADDAIFYLRSRGIPEDVARDLLVEAFLDEAVAEVHDDTVRQAFKQSIAGWRAAHSKEAER